MFYEWKLFLKENYSYRIEVPTSVDVLDLDAPWAVETQDQILLSFVAFIFGSSPLGWPNNIDTLVHVK